MVPQKTPRGTKYFQEAAVRKANLQPKLGAPASQPLGETSATFKVLTVLVSAE